MARSTTPATDGMRRCIGSRTFGIDAHEAPVDDFPTQPSQKDGLGRMCHAHWRQYTNALRKAAVARKASGTATDVIETPDAAPTVPAHEHTLAASLVGEGAPIEAPASRRARRAKAAVQPEADAA